MIQFDVSAFEVASGDEVMPGQPHSDANAGMLLCSVVYMCASCNGFRVVMVCEVPNEIKKTCVRQTFSDGEEVDTVEHRRNENSLLTTDNRTDYC